MYKKNFVAAIKVGGKVLRESSEQVKLPFGSEYGILLKNLDTVRIKAKIQIDCKDAVDWVVLYPGQEAEIERYLEKGGNLNQGNRFKFIERTEEIENHRGVKAEDGLVRIEFQKEKVSPKITWNTHYHYTYPYRPHNHDPYFYNTLSRSSGIGGQSVNSSVRGMRSSVGASSVLRGHQMSAMNVQMAASNSMTDMFKYSKQNENEAGITVQGSLSDQKFHLVADFETEASEVVVLHLVGRTAGKKVSVATTVQTKVQCETCGRTSKSNEKFCKNCGTSLERV